MTVQDVIDVVIGSLPTPLSDTVDTVKAGDPSRPVRGVATTFLATCDVIERSMARGANLVITHEPTFYYHHDTVDWLDGDGVYAYKRRLIDSNDLVVWRCHDTLHRFKPDGVNLGFLAAVGWNRWVADASYDQVHLPPTSLKHVAETLKKELALPAIRVVGDPSMSCENIGLLLGAYGGHAQIAFLRRNDVDVLVVGEINEWETCEYVRDARSAGAKKALIVLGHVQSEEPGMGYLAEWLSSRLPQLDVAHVPAGDPFQRW